MYAIAVTGSNKWFNRNAIYDAMSQYPEDTILVHGDSVGADLYADVIGDDLGFAKVMVPILNTGRNKRVISEKSDLIASVLVGFELQGYKCKVYAFGSPVAHGKVTAIARAARRRGLDYEVIQD